MDTHDDYSYGILPFIHQDGVWEVFLINQYGSGGDVYWTFPKGHAEKDETPIQAALRELHEETHITIAQIQEEKPYTQEYSFMHGETLINKKVVYYLGYAATADFIIQEDEVKEAGWFSVDMALQKLTFDPSKNMLKEAVNDLTS